MPPKAGQSNLFWQDDVYRVLRLFLARAANLFQQVFPLLSNELAVLGVSQPRLAAAKEHDSCSAQDNQAGEQGQYAEADELSVGDEDARRVHRLLQGDLKQVSLRCSQQLVKGVGREGVVLWSESKHSVVHWLGTSRLGSGLGSVMKRTRGTRKPFLASAAKRSVGLTDARSLVGAGLAGAGRQAGVVARETSEAEGAGARKSEAVVCTVATIEAGVRLAAVNTDVTEVSRKSRGTHTGRRSCGATGIDARASIVTRRAEGQSNTVRVYCRGLLLLFLLFNTKRQSTHSLYHHVFIKYRTM